MPSIHETPCDDPNVPTGNIVGTHWKEGRCYYEGRPQGSKVAARTDHELIKLLREKQRSLIKEQGKAAGYIYPNNKAWEFRIF